MAEIQLPWFLACDHVPIGAASGAMLAGEGGATQAAGTITTQDGFRMLTTSATALMRRTIPACNDVTCGVRLVATSATGSATVVNVETAGGVSIVHLYSNAGNLEVRKGATVLAATGHSLLATRYIEYRVTLAGPGADAFILRIDGAEAVALTGLTLGTEPIGRISSVGTSLFNSHCTHWYIRDATGLSNAFYGPILPRWLPAATDVGTQQWTRNGGTTNAGRVRDYPGGSDGATTCVETTTLGHKDEYKLDALPEGVNSIIAVVPFAVSTAPSGGAPQIRLGVKTSDGETAAPERTVGVSGSQTQCGHALTSKPGGGGWSRAAVNEIALTMEAV